MKRKIEKVDEFEKKILFVIQKKMEKNEFEDALILISIICRIEYRFNQRYTFLLVEQYINDIAKKLLKPISNSKRKEEYVLFFDLFGNNTRGLALLYLKALKNKYKIIYVTEQKNIDKIPDIKQNVILSQGVIYGLKRKEKLGKIKELYDLVEKYTPQNMFLYSTPDDVVGTTVFVLYKNIATRFLINLTDHAFWLGKNAFDYCIEFRDYGAFITNKYRGIERNKIIKLPYYPDLNNKENFKGYPEGMYGKEFVFSGGSLYKTISDDNLYYEMVEYILKQYKNICFWYAGEGNEYGYKMKELIRKYPERVFWTSERADFYQILCKSIFYLNTYPVGGGLMIQYAALAGKVPIILKYDESGSGLLVDQKKLNIELDSIEKIKLEIHRLLTDREYRETRENILKKAVLNSTEFEEELYNLIENHTTKFSISYDETDVKKFKKIYYDKFEDSCLEEYLIGRDTLRLFKVFPFQFLKGGYKKVKKRIAEKIFKGVNND